MSQKETPEIIEFDFSEFHPLDHSVWLCVGYYGGVRKHIELAWAYIWSPSVGRALWCSWERHSWAEGQRRTKEETYEHIVICDRCYIEKGTSPR